MHPAVSFFLVQMGDEKQTLSNICNADMFVKQAMWNSVSASGSRLHIYFAL